VGADGKPVPAEAQGAFPLMVKYLLPPGLRGIVVAGLLSALMGSLAGVFNACSTLFTVDLYQKFRPLASQHELGPDGPHRDGRHDPHRARVDPRHPGRPRPLRLPAVGPGLPRPADLRRLLLRRLLEAPQRQGCLWAMVVGFLLGGFRMAVDTPVTMKLAGFEQGYPRAPSSGS
jgi:SSS family solute:Na+ symporter